MTTRRHRFLLLLATLAVSLAALTVQAPSATATPVAGASFVTTPAADPPTPCPVQTPCGPCPAHSFCLYQYAGGGGQAVAFSDTPGRRLCDFRRLPAREGVTNFENKASSMINNTYLTIKLFNGLGCTGSREYTALPRSSDSTFVNNDFDNRASGVNIPSRP